MKNILILLAVSFSLSTARAELAASHKAAIEKLLTVMQVQKQFETNLVAGFETGLGASADQIKALPQEQQDKFNKAIEKVKTALLESMGWEKLKPEIVEIYGKNFTEKEASDAAALMESPAGQMLVSKQITVAADMMKVSQDKMKVLMPQIMQIMQTEMTK
ncbi:MAG: DUF2059 domain-containing protein [Prosthecobacter sp.]